ncbi:MAG: DUF3347 domain-containing protein [Bacteroidia bacterium]|nr:DUF3347 domain-containing protein [Bacteroidia bacterium]NNM22758.1 DUF3347 domain-containing protein [Flavobacteriaceae bacterium]
MKNLVLPLICFCIVLFTACKNTNENQEPQPEVVTVDMGKKKTYEAAESDVTFNDPKVADIYGSYIQLKTALVNSDAESTATSAKELINALENKGDEEELLKAAQTIATSSDIEVQRKEFVLVTSGLEKMLEGAISSGVIYKQYCPMAFDFEGGFWLSNSKEIYNPYFGDKMLRCGKVDSEIK